MKGSCGHETDRLYRITSTKEWICEECVLDTCDMVHAGNLEDWDDISLENAGIEK